MEDFIIDSLKKNLGCRFTSLPSSLSPGIENPRLLIENPVQRLGATGAREVKQHFSFKDINWDTLAISIYHCRPEIQI
ncbi:putative serine/threonine protein kinase IRE [Camellia lanceoleosa]|uniref:Serine/threonine protein kinase IRE n=1 Tax=Camellia lanceoleosa TaxID=1840588 RepID=A0ACC0FNJ0_9ERIC|nr:putative serine/threonine protein kinase IRE [Camellia lanceoleosa]